MSWLREHWRWLVYAEIPASLRQKHNEPLLVGDLWDKAKADPLNASLYIGGMSCADGLRAHLDLTTRLIRDLEQLKNDNRTHKASRTSRALQSSPRAKRSRP